MAQQLDSEYTLVDTPSTEDGNDVILPTPLPRSTKQEDTGELDQLFDETEQACSFEEYKQVLLFCSEKERKDLISIQSLPQLMKDNLFFQNEEMLSSSKERVKANASNDEELKKFVKLLNSVVNSQQEPVQQQQALKLIEMLNAATLMSQNGNTSLQSSNKVFEKISPIFQETNTFSRDKVAVSPLPLQLLKEATQCSKQRQKYLQEGNLDDAEKCLSDAMDKIEVSVIRAEKQMSGAEKKHNEVACTNRYIGVQKLEEEVREAICTDNNRINLLKAHCAQDIEKIEKASHTLERVYQNSKRHSQQLNHFQIKELEKNKKEQDELETRLRVLRESAKKIGRQREHAGKQDDSGVKIYEASKRKMFQWHEEIVTLQSQAQHGAGVLNLVQECSDCVTQEFYTVHKQYLSDLNHLAVKSQELYRQCLVGSIVAFRFRTHELETNISSLELLMAPKKEDLKQQRRTGLKVIADKTQTQLEELGGYKHSYMCAKQSLDPLLEDAFQRLAILDTAIMHRVPDAKLESVDHIYEEERNQLDNEWDNYEMQSLTRAYF